MLLTKTHFPCLTPAYYSKLQLLNELMLLRKTFAHYQKRMLSTEVPAHLEAPAHCWNSWSLLKPLLLTEMPPHYCKFLPMADSSSWHQLGRQKHERTNLFWKLVIYWCHQVFYPLGIHHLRVPAWSAPWFLLASWVGTSNTCLEGQTERQLGRDILESSDTWSCA